MLFPIWTPAELSSEFKSYAHECWRLVEAQYLIATLPLVDSLDEQRVLEDLIDKTKPVIPPEFRKFVGDAFPISPTETRLSISPGRTNTRRFLCSRGG